jgi:hypothetical protein
MSQGKISVSVWSESQEPIVSEKRAHRRFWPPSVIGLVGSLLLHSLALQIVVSGTQAHKIRVPEIQNPGSSLNKSDTKPAERLVFVDLPRTPKANDEIGAVLALVRAAVKDTPIALVHPDLPAPIDVETLALSDDKDSASSVDSGDGVERARLFGIYSGQIHARIDRIWRRPRTPVNEGNDSSITADVAKYFYCQVQIVQDQHGNVQEILLPNCNGSVAWRRSLVVAIQQSSPLPAPPSPTVFTYSLAMSFEGHEFSPGSLADDYELETRPSILAVNGVQRLAQPPISGMPHQGDDSREPADQDRTGEPAGQLTGPARPLDENLQ